MATDRRVDEVHGTIHKGLAEGKVGTLAGAMLGISCVAPGYTLTASIGVIVAAATRVVAEKAIRRSLLLVRMVHLSMMGPIGYSWSHARREIPHLRYSCRCWA